MSTVSILVEGSACSWGKFGTVHKSGGIQHVIKSIISFANAHLSLSSSNKVLLFMYANGLQKKLLFNSQESSTSDHSMLMAQEIRSTLRQSAQSDDLDCSSPLAAALTHAICHMKQNDVSNAQTSGEIATTNNSANQINYANGRVVIISMTTDFGSEHGALMNLFFSAAKQGVCVDVASMGEASPLLQQAADITNGQFVQIDSPRHLLKYLMISLLPPPTSRSLFPQPTLQTVDYRASCACHHQLVSSGWVCSVCLSVLCKFVPICKVCKAVFKINLPIKKNLKRKVK